MLECRLNGIRVEVFASASEFLAAKRTDGPSCLILDVRLPGMSGLHFQAELAKANNGIPIIFITGHGDIPMSVKAMKAGAVEFLTKPFHDQDLMDDENDWRHFRLMTPSPTAASVRAALSSLVRSVGPS